MSPENSRIFERVEPPIVVIIRRSVLMLGVGGE